MNLCFKTNVTKYEYENDKNKYNRYAKLHNCAIILKEGNIIDMKILN